MATRIIIETNDPEIKAKTWDICLLLKDALSEFSSNRGPTAEEYVERRYPPEKGYTWLDPEKKAKEVRDRIALAKKLHESMAFFEIYWGETNKINPPY